MKSRFSPHGITEDMGTDNTPQFLSANGSSFSMCADEYGFTYITSVLHYPRSNSAVEAVVKAIKSLLKKIKDLHLTVLAYHSSLPEDDGTNAALQIIYAHS